ncbi:MAG TPA: sialate O-acetylesterase, partial [Candidatus Anammoximicrobium sp.]|nr:sialate O-acetylesterase [Candidatus Anammoximicrobium sp.]
GVGMNGQGGTFFGTIQDTGGDLSVNKLGSGTLTLGGDNSYNGATTIASGGTLVITHANALGTTGGGTTVSANATLAIDGVATAEPLSIRGVGVGSAGALQGIGTAAVTGALTVANDANVGVAAAGDRLTIDSQLTTEYRLTKVGAGTLILTNGSNTCGDTTVSGGTLLVQNASGSATGTSAVSVYLANGGVFAGTGSVDSPVRVLSGQTGTVAPADPGSADTTDDLGVGYLELISGNATLSIEIDGTAAGAFDQVVAAGGVTLSGSPNLALTRLTGYTVTAGDAWVIVRNDSVDAVSGTFAGLAEGAAIANFLGSAYTAHITYQGGDGNDIELVVDGPAAYTAPSDGAGTNLKLRRRDGNVQYLVNDVVVDARPISAVTSVTITGEANQDDTLTVDFSGGNPIPAGELSYDGGAEGSDELVLIGGVFHTVTFTCFNAHDGRVALDPDGPGGTAASVISYTGLEPVTSSITSDVVELLYTGAGETITVTDAGGGQTTVASTLGETTTFENPTQRLEVAATNGTDVVNINSLASGYGSLVVRGDDVTDVVNFNGPLTFAADHGLTVADVGTVNLPNTASDIAASGTGAVSITAWKTIVLASESSITAVDGDITLSANQQEPPTTGEWYAGISLAGATVSTTGSGSICLAGRGPTLGQNNYGVAVRQGSMVSSGATGTVTVQGIGGAGTNHNHGVMVLDSGSRITSAGGDVHVFGQGGDSSGYNNYGVFVSSGEIASGGSGAVTVQGTGGNGTNGNTGVLVFSSGSRITSAGGNVLVTGHGGNASGINNRGVYVTGGEIRGGGDGSVTVQGTGGVGTDGNCGVSLNGGQITSGGGNVGVTGQGGEASGLENNGVYVYFGTITSGGNGSVTVEGTGGGGTGSNAGVAIEGSPARITSGGGNIDVTAAAGAGASSFGIAIDTGQIRGVTGSPIVTLSADSMNLTPTLSVDGGANPVVLRPRTAGTRIDLGGADVLTGSPLTLGLTDAELDSVTAGTLRIGEAASGSISLTAAITRPASTTVELHSGAAIDFYPGSLDTAGGNLLLAPGAGGVLPRTAAADVTVGGVSFAGGAQLAIQIDGTTADSGYSQLNVAGTVDLTGAALTLSGSHAPTYGDTFVIVNNDGSDAVVGTFAGLAEGATMPNFLGTSFSAAISYLGGDGNDVVLTVLPAISIASPVAYQTLQRNGSNQAAISISGAYIGTPTAIEARFNGGSWATIDASPSGNTFSGTLAAQAAGQGALEVRFAGDSSTTRSVADVGIGDVFVIAGQSNAEGYATNQQSYSHATLKGTLFRETGSWTQLADPTDVDGGGSVWPLLATLYMADQAVPVAFVTVAEGGTGLVDPAEWSNTAGAQYTQLLNRIAASGANAVKAVLWFQGERDAISGVGRASYNAALDQLAADLAEDVVGAPPLVCAQIGSMAAQLEVTADEIDAIRLAQSDAWEDNAGIYAGPSTYDIDNDGLHFVTDAAMQTLANRWWAALDQAFLGGSAGRGPQLVSAEYQLATAQVLLTFDRDLADPGGNYTAGAFGVFADGTPVSISAVSRTTARTVTIALASAAAGTITVSLGSGNTGEAAIIPRGTDPYLLPAETFIGQCSSNLTLAATLLDGTLTITDLDPTGVDNELTVSFNGTALVIGDVNERFAAAPAGGLLSNNDHTLTISMPDSLIVNLAGGDDILTVDFSGGNPIPAGELSYDGGAEGSDELVLIGGVFHTVTFTCFNAHDGRVALDPDGPGGTAASVISYTGLEPVTSSITSDVVELLYTGAGETITVSDAGGGQTNAVSTLGESTTFVNPTERLEITATNGTDVVDVNSLAGGYASLVIGGDDVTDVVNFNGPITFAADHGLTVTDVGTVSLPNTTSDIAASGTGVVSITVLKSIGLASGASIT